MINSVFSYFVNYKSKIDKLKINHIVNGMVNIRTEYVEWKDRGTTSINKRC